jgi:anti-sigma regulatory factor (Ser/Thr protein kinase)
VSDGIRRTHPEVVTAGAWNDSARYDGRDQPLRRAEQPPGLSGPWEIAFGHDLLTFRENLAESLRAHGLPAAKVVDLLLASTEVVANALTHGAGITAIRVGRVAGRLALDVVDQGPGFDDPMAGYLATRDGRGVGLWVARQLMWDVGFFPSAEGFMARITA